jgi:predicted double-glycine peptidase
MLHFPDSRQGTPDMCGVAATQAVLYYYGQSMIQSSLAEELKMDPAIGVEPDQIVRFFKDNGFKVVFGPMTIEDVQNYIDHGIPVIMLAQAWAAEYPVDYTGVSEEGHYIVAMGYDDNKIIFDDPALMDNRGYINKDELMTRWRMVGSDDVTVLENYGIAVWGKRPWFRPDAMFHIDASVKRVAARWRYRHDILGSRR